MHNVFEIVQYCWGERQRKTAQGVRKHHVNCIYDCDIQHLIIIQLQYKVQKPAEAYNFIYLNFQLSWTFFSLVLPLQWADHFMFLMIYCNK